jgi:hypothetical protein
VEKKNRALTGGPGVSAAEEKRRGGAPALLGLGLLLAAAGRLFFSPISNFFSVLFYSLFFQSLFQKGF